jgi:hypothetical protein
MVVTPLWTTVTMRPKGVLAGDGQQSAGSGRGGGRHGSPYRAIKRRVRASQGFRSFWGAYRTIQGYEAMHAIRKGQARWVGAGQIVRQLHFIAKLFQTTI